MSLMGSLACLPSSTVLERLCRSTLASLFPNKESYLAHRDSVALQRVLRDLEGPREIAENFHAVLLTLRSVALGTCPKNVLNAASSISGDGVGVTDARMRFMRQIFDWFWALFRGRPANVVVNAVGQGGLTHIEASVQVRWQHFILFVVSPSEYSNSPESFSDWPTSGQTALS